MKVIYVWGSTCVGKSTLMQKAKDYSSKVGLCEVGKEFRKKYPPEYFRGQGAPAHTQDEALDILKEFYEKYKEKKFLLVDGQPRDESQLDTILDLFQDHEQNVWWLFADKHDIRSRIWERFPDDLESRKLAFERVDNDRIQLFDVAWGLLDKGLKILPVMHNENFDYVRFFKEQLPL